MANDTTAEFDLGPLSWVQGEIDQALNRGLEALAMFKAAPQDGTALKRARTHVHQAAGAIQMVGLDAVVAFTDEIERQLARLDDLAQPEVAPACDPIDRACRKLRIFLDELVNGAVPVPLKLFPEYEAMQRARGVRAPAPTDLFYPDLAVRAPRLTGSVGLAASRLPSYLLKQRRQYQRGLLCWLRGDEDGSRQMRDAIAGIEEATTQANLRAFWWTAGALLDALIERGLEASFGVKQLAARIDLQIRRVVEGSAKAADRLRREVLYYVAISAPVAPSVQAVQRGFRLAGLIPSAEVLNSDLVRIQPHLREAREQLGVAKDAWLKYISGRAENLPRLKQTLASVHAHGAEFGNGALMKLTSALVARLQRMPAGGVSEPVAMEYATAMLLAESAFENYANLSPDFPKQVDVMLARLDAAQAARPFAGGAAAPVLDEMSKRAQERLLMAQVGREIQANLRHMEQVLDSFFRDHGKRDELASLAKDGSQIRGALRMLGLDAADELLASCQAQIGAYADPEAQILDDDLELLAESLSGLGFYIEAVEQQRPDRDRLIAPLLAKRRGETPPSPSTGDEDSVEAAVAELRGALPDLVADVHRAPADGVAHETLKAKLGALRDDAELIGDAELVAQTQGALRELEEGGAAGLAAAVTAIAESGGAAPAPEVSAETQRLLASDDHALDAELLEIFLTEAAEVLDTIAQHHRILGHNPGDHEALRTVRRQFHTLKGSGRMVGLTELGEIAYDVEKIHNRLLEEDRTVGPAVLALIGVAEAEFRQWVSELGAAGRVQPDPARVHAAIRAVEAEWPGARESVIKEVPAAASPTLAEAPLAAPVREFAAILTLASLSSAADAATGAGAVAAGSVSAAALPSLVPPAGEVPAPAEATAGEVAPYTVVATVPESLDVMAASVLAAPAIGLDGVAAPFEATSFEAAPSGAAAGGGAIDAPELGGGSADAAGPFEWSELAEVGGGDFGDAPQITLLTEESAPTIEDIEVASPPSFVRRLSLVPPIHDALDAALPSIDEAPIYDGFHAVPPSIDESSGRDALDVAPAAIDESSGSVLRPMFPEIALPPSEAADSSLVPEPPVAQPFAPAPTASDAEPAPPAFTPLHAEGDAAETGPPAYEFAAEEITIGGVTLSRSLYEILVAEADEHLATLTHELGLLQFDPSQAVSAAMVRAGHTLCGIHRTGGFRLVALTAKALEQCLLVLQQRAAPVPSAAHPMLARAVQGLAALVVRLKDQQPFTAADEAEADEIQGELDLLRQDTTRQAAPADAEAQAEAAARDDEHGTLDVMAAGATSTPSDVAEPRPGRREAATLPHVAAETPLAILRDEVDDQLLPIFLEEAGELFPQAGEQLRAWRRNPVDREPAAGLRRTLHTFKGSARMAGAMRLGELTHRMESHLLEGDDPAAGTAELFDALDTDLDRVAFVLDALRAGRSNVDLPWLASERGAELAPAASLEPEAAEPAPHATATTGAVVVPLPGLPPLPSPTRGVHPSPAHARATAPVEADPAQRAMLRVRADIIDRLVNEAGEVAITRARVEGELRALKANLLELTTSVIRMRGQVREIEIQAESQIQSRLTLRHETHSDFDPLEFDRYTRFQELTRSLAEGVNDVSTVQQALLRNIDDADAALVAQARLSREVQQQLFSIRTVPFGSVAERLYRILRQVAKELDKRVNLDMRGTQVELDRSVLEKLVGPLEHLLRNALDHGIEARELRTRAGKHATGEILLTVRQVGNEIAIELADDGAGLDLARIHARAIAQGRFPADAQPTDAQLIECIFQPGFSTASKITQLSGRGIGMDVVRSDVAALGGRVEVTTRPGQGTTFLLYLPLTLAVAQAVLVRAGGRLWALPAPMVEQVQQIKAEALAVHYAQRALQWQGRSYAFHYLPRLLGDTQHSPTPARHNAVLLLRTGQGVAAIHVDEMVGKQEVVVKNIGPQLARVSGIAGATVLGTGEIVLIINPVQLAQRADVPDFNPQAAALVATASPAQPGAQAAAAGPPLVLVIDDSLTVRKITSRLLTREGFAVTTAKDGIDALQALEEAVPDVILLDIEMPRMDGFEFARTIKAEPRHAHIPIIMITSRTAEKHRNRAKELGVDLYLGKPYQEEELLRHVREMLGVTV